MSGRALLEALGPILEPARTLRYQADDDFDDVGTDELELAARALRAISWSCIKGAHHLERIAVLRQQALR